MFAILPPFLYSFSINMLVFLIFNAIHKYSEKDLRGWVESSSSVYFHFKLSVMFTSALRKKVFQLMKKSRQKFYFFVDRPTFLPSFVVLDGRSETPPYGEWFDACRFAFKQLRNMCCVWLRLHTVPSEAQPECCLILIAFYLFTFRSNISHFWRIADQLMELFAPKIFRA